MNDDNVWRQPGRRVPVPACMRKPFSFQRCITNELNRVDKRTKSVRRKVKKIDLFAEPRAPKAARPRPDEAHQIVRVTAYAHGFTVDQMMRGHTSEKLDARRATMRALRAIGMSYPAIGREMGHADHTTAMFVCRGMNL